MDWWIDGLVDQCTVSEMNRHFAFLGLCALTLYSCAYTALYHFRRPSASLGYWCYIAGGREAGTPERCVYYCLYPIDFVHQRFLGAGWHTWDRPVSYFPAGF